MELFPPPEHEQLRGIGLDEQRCLPFLLAARENLGMLPMQTVPLVRPLSPEAHLAMAMIERALDDLAGRSLLSSDFKGLHAYKVQKEARRWINGAPASLTFEFACILAGLEPVVVRERAAKLKQRAGRAERFGAAPFSARIRFPSRDEPERHLIADLEGHQLPHR